MEEKEISIPSSPVIRFIAIQDVREDKKYHALKFVFVNFSEGGKDSQAEIVKKGVGGRKIPNASRLPA